MSQRIEIAGMNYVERIVNNDLGWIWRPTSGHDYGIDATIEIAEQYKKRTNALLREIKVQVKSGEKYFRTKDKAVIHEIDQRTYKYWSDSPTPVIIVAYSPELENAWWIEFSKGVKLATNGEYRIEIPLCDQHLFSTDRKTLLSLLSCRITKYGLENAGFIDCLSSTLQNTPLTLGDKDIIRSLVLSAEVNYLARDRKMRSPRSLLAIDTSMEDFDVHAWQTDKDFSIYCKHLLSIKRSHQEAFNYTQIFSVSVPLRNPMIWDALVFQIRLLQKNNIKAGVVIRNRLSNDLNRDFSIINGDLVMNYNTGTWNCTPNPGMTPASVHLQIFKDVSSRTFWCTGADWEVGLAKYLTT